MNEGFLHWELDFCWSASDLSLDLKQTSFVVQGRNLTQHALGLFANSLHYLLHAENDHIDICLFITHTSYHPGLNQFVINQTFSMHQGQVECAGLPWEKCLLYFMSSSGSDFSEQ